MSELVLENVKSIDDTDYGPFEFGGGYDEYGAFVARRYPSMRRMRPAYPSYQQRYQRPQQYQQPRRAPPRPQQYQPSYQQPSYQQPSSSYTAPTTSTSSTSTTPSYTAPAESAPAESAPAYPPVAYPPGYYPPPAYPPYAYAPPAYAPPAYAPPAYAPPAYAPAPEYPPPPYDPYARQVTQEPTYAPPTGLPGQYEFGAWPRLSRMWKRAGSRMAVRSRPGAGITPGVVQLEEGLFLVGEVPEEMIDPEMGILPLVLPLMLEAGKKALQRNDIQIRPWAARGMELVPEDATATEGTVLGAVDEEDGAGRRQRRFVFRCPRWLCPRRAAEVGFSL